MTLRSPLVRVVAFAVVVLVAQPSYAHADVPVLSDILNVLKKINTFAGKIRDALGRAYPAGVEEAIRTWLEPVMSIQQEMQRLSCGWEWTPRTRRLSRIFDGASYCKRDIRSFFGTHPYQNDREEFYDWKTALRLNMVSDRMKLSDQRARAAHENIRKATIAGLQDRAAQAATGVSPGEAERVTALVTAEMGQQAVETGDLWAQMLDQDLERFNEKRYKRRLEMVAGLAMMNLHQQTSIPSPGDGAAVVLGELQ